MTAPYAAEDQTPEPTEPASIETREGKGKMDDEEAQRIINALCADSTEYVDGVLSPERANAHKYYNGEKFGNEEEGRSQVVMPEVASAVSGMMPDLMRIFTGTKHAVEFDPTRPDTTAIAAQMTDVVRMVFEKENPGFQIIHDSLWDGLVKKTGIVKWGWQDYATKQYTLKNLTPDQIEALEADEDVTIGAREKEDEQIEQQPSEADLMGYAQMMEQVQAAEQQGQQVDHSKLPPAPQPYMVDGYTCEVTYRIPDGRPCVWAVPPEELLVLRRSRNLAEALYMGHRMVKSSGQLREMGVSDEDIEEHGGRSNWLNFNAEEIERQPDKMVVDAPLAAGEANDEHDYIEHYVFMDYNGDGLLELRLICTIGTGNFIVKNKMISCRPFAVWGPYPTPHQIIARSLADKTMDLQKINSALVRSGLDSLSASIFPRTAYQEGQVSAADINNTEIGAGIRTKGRPEDVLKTFSHNFMGKEIFAFLDYFRQEKETRTGNTGAQGLDMDALQSTTPDAAAEAVASNKQQVEMIARIYAEMILKPVFRGIARMIVENQPRKRTIRLRGAWVDVDPASWDMDADVTVQVAIGRFEERKKIVLLGVKQVQETILTTLGAGNPLVHLSQYYNTLEDLLKADGIMDVSRYFQKVDPNWQPPPQQPQESPEQIIARAEMEIKKMETLGKLAIEHDKITLEREKMEREDAQATAKLAADQNPQEKLAEIEARQQEKAAEIAQRAEATRAELDQKGQLAREQMQLDLLIAREKNEMEISKAREQAHISAQSQRDTAATNAETTKHVAEVNATATVLSKPEPKETPAPKPAPAPKLPDVHVHMDGGKKKRTSKLKKVDADHYEVETEETD